MSKKLIAVAAAAALALTGLVGVAPANAAAFTVKINESVSNIAGDSSKADADAYSVIAMTSGTLDYSTSLSSTRNVNRFDVTTTAGTKVEVTSAGGVLVIDDVSDADGTARKLSAGTTSFSGTASAGATTVTFYAYTSSTTAGTVVIQTSTTKATYWIKGTAGNAYNLVDVKFPASIQNGVLEVDSEDIISYKVTDVFGNQLTTGVTFGTSDHNVNVDALGASTRAHTYSTTRKVWEAAVFSGTSASVAMSVTLKAVDLSDNGFAKPVKYAFSSVSAGSLAEQVASLKLQVAALQVIVDRKVTKKRYNTLARKWNTANPSAKVALKK